MRYLALFFASLFPLFLTAGCDRQDEAEDPVEKKIDALLQEMTLEEKVGQMTQINLGLFYKDGYLNKEMLKEYVVRYGIGSILNAPTVNGMSQAISLEEWNSLITLIQRQAMETRLRIPVLYGIDAIHGATYIKGSTLFPHNIALAASRNRFVAARCAQVTAREVRAAGIRWNFDPVVGVGRQPLWPRFEETFGESYYLVGNMARKVVEAYEGEGLTAPRSVASCLKHYVGYPVPVSGKDRTPAVIARHELHDIFLAPFRVGILAGSSTVMLNSASINGIPVHADKYLITDVLKKEFGFDGLVVTDWEDIINLWKEHHVARNNKEAVMMAVNAGIDMSMVPNDLSFYHDLIALVKENKVKMSRIDDAVRRILRIKFRLGLFDDPFPEPEAVASFGRKVYQYVAMSAARECMTLLKNDTLHGKPVLPLSKNVRVLLAGPGVNSLATLHGSWSYCWQGNIDSLYPSNTHTIREAMENMIGKDHVITVAPPHFAEITPMQIAAVRRKAAAADVIVLCLGEDSYAESPGNINDLTLSYDQRALAEAAATTGKPVIYVLTEGRPRIISEIVPFADAILMAYRPGSKGAEAIVETLFGKNVPSGRLPFSYPRYTGNLIPYDAPVRTEKYYDPQWPFGYGLSYTTFAWSDLTLSKDTVTLRDTLWVSFHLTNTGSIGAKVAVDLFVKDYTASVTPPMKTLHRYRKIWIEPGETKKVVFTLRRFDYSFADENGNIRLEPGKMAVIVENMKKEFYLKTH